MAEDDSTAPQTAQLIPDSREFLPAAILEQVRLGVTHRTMQ